MRCIYLDFNATTPISPIVLEAMQPFLTEHFGNPSSQHALGKACAHAVEAAREQVARLLGATADEIIFTSGGTESNNLAIRGVAQRRKHGHVITSAIEHPAVSEPVAHLRNFEVSRCTCDRDGVVHASIVQELITEETILVSVMHANNETGVIQPVHEIASCCRSRGILMHTDAAQSVGKIQTKVHELDVDLLSIAGHKLYAPKGVGALYLRRGVDIDPILFGAGHEMGLRPGTENVASIVGLGKAAELAEQAVTETTARMTDLRDGLQGALRQAIGPELVVFGERVKRLPNTLCVSFPRVSGYELLKRTPELCASTGAACHAGDSAVSGTLAAMGVTAEQARGTVRLSLGWTTSVEEVERAASRLIGAWESLSAA